MNQKKVVMNFDFSKPIISLENLTKDYGKGRGIFNISFSVKKGEVYGYCGTNGAGKTTTLRSIMGFIKPNSGCVSLFGVDPWKDGDLIKKHVGYLPGEIAFPSVDTGSDFLKIQADMLGLKDMSKAERMINMFQLDPTISLKRMSKGTKQKTAIVAAFMHSPQVVILDEPTQGLDPLMRKAFISFIKEEKERGTTILMTNHDFTELEQTCDYVGFIKKGKLINSIEVKNITDRKIRQYKLGFNSLEEFERFNFANCEITLKNIDELVYSIKIDVKDTVSFIEEIKKFNLKFFNEEKYSLEKYFMDDVGVKKDE